MKSAMSVAKATLLFLMAFSVTCTAYAQPGVGSSGGCIVSNTAMGVSCMATLGDYNGEQTVWILSSSYSGEIDTYAEATWTNDSEAESVYLIDLAAWIGQDSTNNQVKTGERKTIMIPKFR
jgi:hypothetical protein